MRAKRVDESDNKLAHVLENVVGHELDWLSFAMEQRKRLICGFKRDSKCDFNHVWRLRSLLAEVTSSGPLQSPGSVLWDDERIAVRTVARELCNVICDAAWILGRDRNPNKSEVVKLPIPWGIGKKTVDIKLCYNEDSVSDNPWTVNCAEIEAIRLWSMVAYEDIFGDVDERADEAQAEENNTASGDASTSKFAQLFGRNWFVPKMTDVGNSDTRRVDAELILKAQIVPGRHSTEGSSTAIRMMVKMWLGDQANPKIEEAVIRWENRHRGCLWEASSTSDGADWKPRNKRPLIKGAHQDSIVESYCWFFGWIPAQYLVGGRTTARVCFVSTQNSLLAECAKELFTVFLASMIKIPAFGAKKSFPVEPEFQSGSVRWNSPTIRELATAFTAHHLGSNAESILCIASTLEEMLNYPNIETTVTIARRYRSEKLWDAAEGLLRWAFGYYSTWGKEEQTLLRKPVLTNDPDFELYSPLARAFVELGELYRIAIHENPGPFGFKGITWMWQQRRSFPEDQSKSGNAQFVVEDIALRYADVGVWFYGERCGERVESSWAELKTLSRRPGIELRDSDMGLHDLPRMIKEGRIVSTLRLLSLPGIEARVRNKDSTCLIDAVKRGWLEVVAALVNLGADVDALDSTVRTALSYSVEKGYMPITSFLIECGANPEIRDHEKRTPLSRAASAGLTTVVKWLLRMKQVDLNSVDSCGLTPLAHAVKSGNYSTVDVLLENRAKTETPGIVYSSPLLLAIENNDDKMVERLLRAGANHQIKYPSTGMTPLWFAAEFEYKKIVTLLVEYGADAEARVAVSSRTHEYGDPPMHPHTEDDSGWALISLTPLFRAIQVKDVSRVEFLLNLGVRTINERRYYEERTPLMFAVQEGTCEIVELLLEHNVEKEAPSGCNFDSPLILATESFRTDVKTDMIKALLRAKVSLESKNEKGQTSLAIACILGDTDVIKLLVEAGADKYVKDKWRKTPFQHALEGRKKELIKYMGTLDSYWKQEADLVLADWEEDSQ